MKITLADLSSIHGYQIAAQSRAKIFLWKQWVKWLIEKFVQKKKFNIFRVAHFASSCDSSCEQPHSRRALRTSQNVLVSHAKIFLENNNYMQKMFPKNLESTMFSVCWVGKSTLSLVLIRRISILISFIPFQLKVYGHYILTRYQKVSKY